MQFCCYRPGCSTLAASGASGASDLRWDDGTMENHHFLIGEASISMGHFPWRTVSHNQRVYVLHICILYIYVHYYWCNIIFCNCMLHTICPTHIFSFPIQVHVLLEGTTDSYPRWRMLIEDQQNVRLGLWNSPRTPFSQAKYMVQKTCILIINIIQRNTYFLLINWGLRVKISLSFCRY